MRNNFLQQLLILLPSSKLGAPTARICGQRADMYKKMGRGDIAAQEGIFDIRTGKASERSFSHMPVNMVALNKPSRYKFGLKVENETTSMQSLIPQQYTLELEYARAENAALRRQLEEITETQTWKVLQPIRKLAHKLKANV